MHTLTATTTFDSKTNQRTLNISHGKAADLIMSAFRKLPAGTAGRVSDLSFGRHCDFEKRPIGEFAATLFNKDGDVLATAIVDEFDR